VAEKGDEKNTGKPPAMAKEGKDAQAGLEPFVIPLDPTTERIRGLVEGLVVAAGCELVFIQVVGGKRRSTLRVYADTLEPDSSINLTQLEELNHLLGDALDVHDQAHGLFQGSYDLEVSSPGVDRPLAKKSHFEGSLGQRIKVKRRRALGGARSVTGQLEAVSDTGITLATEENAKADAPVELSWDDIADAHIIFTFSKPEKKRGSPRGKKRKGAPKGAENPA
jgi:ribosome maturation factor RimP